MFDLATIEQVLFELIMDLLTLPVGFACHFLKK